MCVVCVCVCVCVLARESQYVTIGEISDILAQSRSIFGTIKVLYHWNGLTDEGLHLIETSGIPFKILLANVVHLMVSVHKPSHAEVFTEKKRATKVTSTLQALSKLRISLEVQMPLSLVHSPHPTASPSLTRNCSPLVSSLKPLAWEE